MSIAMDHLKFKGHTYVYLLGFFLLSLLLYVQSLGFGYVLDDTIVLDENKFVAKGFGGIWDILSKESFTGYFGEQKNLVAGARYRPLSIVTFAIELGLFGKNPFISHLINILLYSLAGWAVFRLMVLLKISNTQGPMPWLPLISALLFLTHPIHSEAVANIKGRDEIMCFLFSVLALNALIRYRDQGKTLFAISSAVLFFLALMSKENAITFLAVAPLVLVFFRQSNWTSAIRSSLVLFPSAILFLIIRASVIGFFFDHGQQITDLMNNPFVGMTGAQKFSTILLSLAWYLKLLFIPHPLTHDYYPYHVPKLDPGDGLAILSFLSLAAISFLAYRLGRKHKVAWFAMLYFWITISIVSNVVFPVGTFMNERFLFMPSLGFVMVLAYFIHSAWFSGIRWQRTFATTLLPVLLLLYSVRTMTRVPDWKDAMSLNLAGVKVSKNSARVNLFTGVSYFQLYQKETDQTARKKYLDLALRYIDRSLYIFPTYGQGLNMKAGILAEYHKMDGNLKGFLDNIRDIIIKKPDLAFVHEYLQYLMKSQDNRYELSVFLRELGYEYYFQKMRKYDLGIQFMTMAKEMRPFSMDYAKELAEIYEAYSKKSGLSPQQRDEMLKKAAELRNPLSMTQLK